MSTPLDLVGALCLVRITFLLKRERFFLMSILSFNFKPLKLIFPISFHPHPLKPISTLPTCSLLFLLRLPPPWLGPTDAPNPARSNGRPHPCSVTRQVNQSPPQVSLSAKLIAHTLLAPHVPHYKQPPVFSYHRLQHAHHNICQVWGSRQCTQCVR